MITVKKFLTSFTLSFLILIFCNAAEPVPNHYKDITLGMSLEDTKEALVRDSDFGYHGDRDVSMLPNNSKTLIETDATKGFGSNFLTQCWFQFNNDELYIITININPQRMDYYSIFTKLVEKYGEPTTISPKAATWKDDDYTMSLEKPLTLKYIDNKAFDEAQNYSTIAPSATETTNKMFLDEL